MSKSLSRTGMTVVITKEVAKSVVLPKDWAKIHLLCAIEAIRRGDYDIALNHISILGSEPKVIVVACHDMTIGGRGNIYKRSTTYIWRERIKGRSRAATAGAILWRRRPER